MRGGVRSGIATVLMLLLLLTSSDDSAIAQAPATSDPAEVCRQTPPAVIFTGTIETIENDLVRYQVEEVTMGSSSVGTTVFVHYPTIYNARLLEIGMSYQVAATADADRLDSLVPTAGLETCGQLTRFSDGAAIDSGVLVGVKDKGSRLLKGVLLVVLLILVILVILGRLFDRRAGYRWRLQRD